MKLKRQIVILAIVILFSLLYTTISNAATATVNTDTLKLRKEASTDSIVLELLNQGQKLQVIEENGDWVKVKVNGITGFVHKDFVKMEGQTSTINTNTTNTITSSQVNEVENVTINTTNENNVVENTTSENKVVQNEVAEPTTNTEEPNTVVIEPEIQEPVNIIKEEILKSDSNVWILPLINATKIANLKKDTKVTILDEIKDWSYIQTEEINGWVRKSVFEQVTTEQNNNTNSPTNNKEEAPTQPTTPKTEETFKEKTMYVNSSSVYIRKGPSTNDEIVDSLILNAQVTVTGEDGDWYKVKVSNKTGYIAKRLLSNNRTQETSRSADERTTETKETTTVATSKGEEIANYAQQFLGCKYVYGASGPNTFDCSGFTMYVYKQFGINLSHSATAQSKNGTYVAKEDLQLGDLVFFKDYETMDGIGHCGIYIGERKLYTCFFRNRILCKNFYIIIWKLL